MKFDLSEVARCAVALGLVVGTIVGATAGLATSTANAQAPAEAAVAAPAAAAQAAAPALPAAAPALPSAAPALLSAAPALPSAAKPAMTKAAAAGQTVPRLKPIRKVAKATDPDSPASPSVTTGSLAKTAAAGGAVAAGGKTSGRCTRMAFEVNDWGKEGPTKDAKDLLDKHIASWAAQKGIKNYKTGNKIVNCRLFLDFGFADEHTCRAEAPVCW